MPECCEHLHSKMSDEESQVKCSDKLRESLEKRNKLPDPLQFAPIDRGWAWMCVVAGFVMNVLVVGAAARSFGILFVEFVELYDASSAETSWITALSQGLALTLGPVASTLATHFTARRIVCLGGVITSAGLLLSMFSPNIAFLYFSYGLLVGLGSGLSYTPTMVIIGMYFDKRRALAIGLTVSGAGIGSFAFPPICRFLLDMYGLKGMLLIFSGVMMNLVICGSLLRPLSYYSPRHKAKTPLNVSLVSLDHLPVIVTEDETDTTKEPLTLCDKLTQVATSSKFEWSLLKNPVFLVYGASMFLCYCGYPALFMILPSHCKSINIDKSSAAFLVSIIGLVDLLSRVFFGWFSDLNLFPKRYIFTVSLFISGAAFIFVGWLTNYVAIAVVCGIIGLFSGSFASLLLPILTDALGVNKMPSAFGLAMLSQGLAFFIGPVIVGSLEDVTGNWLMSFVFAGSTLLMAGFVSLLEPLAQRCTDAQPDNMVAKC